MQRKNQPSLCNPLKVPGFQGFQGPGTRLLGACIHDALVRHPEIETQPALLWGIWITTSVQPLQYNHLNTMS